MNIPTLLKSALLCTVTVLIPRAAHAQDDEPAAAIIPRAAQAQDDEPAATIPARVAVELGIEGAVFGGAQSVVNGVRPGFGGLSIGLLFGFGTRWSAGISGAMLLGEGPDTGDINLVAFWRADVEARYHPILGRWGEVWAGGAVGLGSFGDAPSPHLAAIGGADFHPAPFLSLGVHLRAGAYCAPSDKGGNAAAWAELGGALVIGIHAGREVGRKGDSGE
jgi:hypothetical protein